MKKSLLSLAFAAISFGLMAQESTEYEPYRIGVKLDPNYALFKSDNGDVTNVSGGVKLGFGLIFDKMFAPRYAFGTGINIFRTGGEMSYLMERVGTDAAGADAKQILKMNRTYSMQMVEVPLTLKLRTEQFGPVSYWFQFGVGVSYIMRSSANDTYNILYQKVGVADTSAYAVYGSGSSENMFDTKVDIKDDTRLFRIGMIAGGGIEYPINGNTGLMVGFTYNNGLTNILKGDVVQRKSGADADSPLFNSGNYTPKTSKIHAINNNFMLNIGFMF